MQLFILFSWNHKSNKLNHYTFYEYVIKYMYDF